MGVGAVGVALSVFLVFQLRQTATRLEREIPQNLEHVEQITRSVRYQGEAATKMLETTRERVTFLGASIEQLSKKLSNRDTASSVLLVIDEDIDNQLDNAKQFVLSMQISMRNLGSTLLLFDSMSIFGMKGFGSSDRGASDAPESPVRNVAAGLTHTADLLDQVTHAITKLQSGQSINPIQLNQIHTTLQSVDLELERIKFEIHQFSAVVGETESKFAKLRRSSPAGIRYLSNILSLFLFCFGFAQLMLGVYGLQLIHAARKSRGLSHDIVERIN